MLGGWKETCVRRVIQEMNLHLAHQEVTFSEKASNQKNQAIEGQAARVHTRTQVPHKTGRRVERSCFQEAVIKSEEEYSKYYLNLQTTYKYIYTHIYFKMS